MRIFVSDEKMSTLYNKETKTAFYDAGTNTYTYNIVRTKYPTNSLIICNTDDYKGGEFTYDTPVTMLFSDSIGYLHKFSF